MGQNTYAEWFINMMLGWIRVLANGIASAFQSNSARGSSGGAFLAWFGANWIGLLALLIVLGVGIDWLIWMIRWRPYWLWFRKKRVLLDDDIDTILSDEELMQRYAPPPARPSKRPRFRSALNRRGREPDQYDQYDQYDDDNPDIEDPRTRRPAEDYDYDERDDDPEEYDEYDEYEDDYAPQPFDTLDVDDYDEADYDDEYDDDGALQDEPDVDYDEYDEYDDEYSDEDGDDGDAPRRSFIERLRRTPSEDDPFSIPAERPAKRSSQSSHSRRTKRRHRER